MPYLFVSSSLSSPSLVGSCLESFPLFAAGDRARPFLLSSGEVVPVLIDEPDGCPYSLEVRKAVFHTQADFVWQIQFSWMSRLYPLCMCVGCTVALMFHLPHEVDRVLWFLKYRKTFFSASFDRNACILPPSL